MRKQLKALFSLLVSPLALLTLANPAFAVISKADLAKHTVISYMRALPEGDPRNNIETGHYWFADGRWHLDITLGIWGARDFQDVKKKDVENLSAWQKVERTPLVAEWSMFERGLKSNATGFDRYPEIKSNIERQMRAIESMMTTPFLTTKIRYFFIDEEKLASHPRETWIEALATPSVRATISDRPFVPVRFQPIPARSFITPGAWDPYCQPEFSAHELFHFLSRNHFNDGYIFIDYPLNGIMNGGEEFRRLRALGHKPTLLPLEWNTFLLLQEKARNKNIRSDDAHFQPNYFTIDPMSPINALNDIKTRAFGAGEFALPEGAINLSQAEVYRIEMDEKVRLYLESQPSQSATSRLYPSPMELR